MKGSTSETPMSFACWRALLSGLVSCLFVAVLSASACAQDDEEKKKEDAEKQLEADKKMMTILLQKAEEEYRTFFKRPTKAHEYWAAIKFEIALGKFELAALHLEQLLQRQPPEEIDDDLLKIEEVDGLAA